MNFAIITENDESPWDDITGVQYHFPHKYIKVLVTGTKVIYYKGRMADKKYLDKRLTKEPHYFAIAEIGKVSTKNNKDYYADIINYSPFTIPINFKKDDTYLEEIPEKKRDNYFRDGVREISQENFNKILLDIIGELKNIPETSIDKNNDELTTIYYEGKKKVVYTTKYERDKRARNDAIKIHGLSCMACNTNFEEKYGEHGKGFIHVHHNKPLSSIKKESEIDPKTDLDIVCPNCHSMIHRKKKNILTIEDLRAILK